MRRHFFKRFSPVWGCLLFALTGMQGCLMDDMGDCAADLPGSVTLVIGSENPRSRSAVNYEKEIRSIRIYAFEQEASVPVGYYYAEELLGGETDASGNKYYYCVMPLEKKGDLDFYVLVNDAGAETATVLDGNSTRETVEAFRFTGLKNVVAEPAVEHAVPMSNLLTEGTTGANNRTYTITGDPDKAQFIEVDVTRAMARVQLKFAKVGTDAVTIDRAVLYHGPDEASVMTAEENLTYGNSANREDEFLTTSVAVGTEVTDASNPEGRYDMVAETYMLENTYGSGDLLGNAPADATARANAYRLDITYTVGGKQYNKEVWLPAVKRNQNINILGTLVSNNLQVHLTVEDWVVDGTEIDFSTEFTGMLTPGVAEKSLMVDTDGEGNKAIAVATSSDGKERAATFAFQMKSPVGARWTAHLENTTDFKLEGTTFGYGDKEAVEVEFKVVPLHEHVALDPKSVNLFITVASSFGTTGENEGIQVINPETGGIRKFPGTETKILIRQVGETAYDQLTESITRE